MNWLLIFPIAAILLGIAEFLYAVDVWISRRKS